MDARHYSPVRGLDPLPVPGEYKGLGNHKSSTTKDTKLHEGNLSAVVSFVKLRVLCGSKLLTCATLAAGFDTGCGGCFS